MYWNLRLSALSSLIGYGLIVAVPIISNQVNVQIGALANVIIMLCITVWALYLIFPQQTRHHSGAYPSCRPLAAVLQLVYSRFLRWSGTGWPALTFIVLFFFFAL